MSLQDLEKASATNYVHSMKEQLRELIYSRSQEDFAKGNAARDAVTTPETLKARQVRVREVFLAGLGGLPSMDTPLNAKVGEIIEEDGFHIEKIVYESRPKAYVTANLYVPNGITKPRGAVLFVSGHILEAKHCEEYQTVCRHLVKAGLVVLAHDPIGQGERFGYYDQELGKPIVHPNVWEHDYSGNQCFPLGDGIARYFVHDSMRGIDYLLTRPEVDPAKIGVTGNSGGGLQTAMLMLADPRLAVAVPGTFIMHRQGYQEAGGAQDAEQLWPGFTAEGFDHEDILLAMCPKPVCPLAVTYDFFPIEATRETVARCKRLWKMAGNEDDLQLAEDVSVHIYTTTLARAAARFFSKHLLGKEVEIDSATIKTLKHEQLLCTKSGQVRGELEGSRWVYDENQDRLAALETALKAKPDAERREAATAWLRNKVMSQRRETPTNLRVYANIDDVDELTADLGYWWSQKSLFNEGFLFRSQLEKKKNLPVTIAVWEGGSTNLRPYLRWIRKTCAQGRAVLVLDVSGVGGSAPNAVTARSIHEPLGTLHKLDSDLLWMNDCMCAMRTHDVIRALEALKEWPGVDVSDVEVYAHGDHGVYAELAAAIEPRLSKITVENEFPGYADWVRTRYYEPQGYRMLLMPGILKYADLPDFRRWRSAAK